MARCQRCNSCQSQWDMTACKRCDYPYADKRTQEQIAQDTKEMEENNDSD